jgi:thioesterase domain-containing protein
MLRCYLMRRGARALTCAVSSVACGGAICHADCPIMSSPSLPAPARALDRRIHRDIPLARTIGTSIRAWDGTTLIMDAPLVPNVNDKGCAFGGALTSVMTLAGWAWVVLAMAPRALACDVFVAHSEVAYLAPVWHDFQARAVIAEGADRETFLEALAQRGKARIALHSEVRECGADACCATLAAQFVAKRRDRLTRNPDLTPAQ